MQFVSKCALKSFSEKFIIASTSSGLKHYVISISDKLMILKKYDKVCAENPDNPVG